MKSLTKFSCVPALILLFALNVKAFPNTSDTIQIQIDLNKKIARMDPVWAWFGYDEPNYTYMKDGKKLLSEIAALSPVPVYIRAHNLLTTGNGTADLKWGSTNAYTEDQNGNAVYNWTIIDKIFDTYIERGIKPMAQMGFMPQALSTKPEPYRHFWKPGVTYSTIFTGWRYPPKDYSKWATLIEEWVKHSVQRYGKKEVESWYWELWNEPNIGYWGGTVDEYCKLYDYSVHAVKKVLPRALVGGPHSTGPASKTSAEFLKTFLNHCISGTNYVTGKKGSPIDFIAFHAKGAPKVINGAVQMNLGQQMRDISAGFEIVASFKELNSLPIIIGESDPEGCAACGMKTNPENAYRNGTMYSSYTAAAFARKYAMADHYKINFKGAVSWSFEFENQPWFYGFRDLATNGVDKPVLNVFRMFGKMKGNRLAVEGDLAYDWKAVRDSSIRGTKPDVNALASSTGKQAAIMVWNYHDNDLPAPVENVILNIKNVPAKKVSFTHYRIDSENSNSYEVWKKMGSPQNPTPEQIKQLEAAGSLKQLHAVQTLRPEKGNLTIKFLLPRQGISLVKLDW